MYPLELNNVPDFFSHCRNHFLRFRRPFLGKSEFFLFFYMNNNFFDHFEGVSSRANLLANLLLKAQIKAEFQKEFTMLKLILKYKLI